MVIKISVATSIDGYIDDTSPQRLVLSSSEDWDQVRDMRKQFDAILVGAQTVRRDNPSLVNRDKDGNDPIKVVISRCGDLDPQARFFTQGDGDKIVITSNLAPQSNIDQLKRVANVIVADEHDISVRSIINILSHNGVQNLLIEGGSKILTMFLASGEVDYLRLAVAPFFVGHNDAPRFVGKGQFPHSKENRMHIISTQTLGDMAIMEYALKLSNEDCMMMEIAINEAHRCSTSGSAYSVGAVIISTDGQIFTGYSRESAPNNHAEEEALLKAKASGVSLRGSTIYSTMEPCTSRQSKPASCSSLIIEAGFKRVVFAAYEPTNFVQCNGYSVLHKAGIEVIVAQHLAPKALDINSHILNNAKLRGL